MKEPNRRPIKTRSAEWAQRISGKLIARGVTPNQISVASIAFAIVGLMAVNLDVGFLGSLICIGAIQLRLLCNLFDGMVAVEGGRRSELGDLYNEFPDRITDTLLIVGVGYAASWSDLAWFAALAAALTAYIRVSAGSLGMPQRFIGPMAKQHRMAVLTGSLALNMLEAGIWGTQYAVLVGLLVIAVGSVYTCHKRVQMLAQDIQVYRPGADAERQQPETPSVS